MYLADELSEGASSENVVRPVGFEPTASCSGGKRSIQTELRALWGHYSVAGKRRRCCAYGAFFAVVVRCVVGFGVDVLIGSLVSVSIMLRQYDS